MEQLSSFLELLLTALITALVPTLVAMLAVWLKAKLQELKDQVPANVMDQVDLIAEMVVMAAEQSGLAGLIKNTAEAKKAYAMDMGEQWLRGSLGLMLDLDKLGETFWNAVKLGLDSAIEAKVGTMLNHLDVVELVESEPCE